MASSFVGVILTLVLAYLLSSYTSQCWRDKWMPIVFAYVIWSDSTGRFFMNSNILYYLSFMLTFVCYAIVLSDCKRSHFRHNSTLSIFILFIGSYLAPGLWHEHADVAGKMVCSVLRVVFVGYAASIWALRTPGGFERLFRWVTLSVMLSALQFARYGSWDVATFAEAGGRSVLDETFAADSVEKGRTTNVNAFALMATGLLPYPIVYVANKWQGRYVKVVKVCALVATLIIALVVMRTGSRNGGLALMVIGGYLVLGKTSLKGWKRMALLLTMALGMLVMIIRFVGNTELRAFQLRTEAEKGAYAEQMGSGRLGFYLDIYNRMTTTERLIGAGPPYEYHLYLDGRLLLHIANRHSIYMQVLNTAGWLGVGCMGVFFMVFVSQARKKGIRGHLALMLFSIWAFTGVGEAANITGGGLALYALGIAIALLSNDRLIYQDFNYTGGAAAGRRWR